MPRKGKAGAGDLLLPEGWDVDRDYDGRTFYIDHNTKQTTWVDPRDRWVTKFPNFMHQQRKVLTPFVRKILS